MANPIMSPEFQEIFNLNKGSIPARLDVKMNKFDDCAKKSSVDFVGTSKTGALVASVAHGMAVPAATAGAMQDVVTQFFNSDMTPKAGTEKLAAAAKTKWFVIPSPSRGRVGMGMGFPTEKTSVVFHI